MVVHSCASSLDPRPSMLDERRSSGQLFRCKPYGRRKVLPRSQNRNLAKDFSLLGGILRSGTRARIGIEAFGYSWSSVDLPARSYEPMLILEEVVADEQAEHWGRMTPDSSLVTRFESLS